MKKYLAILKASIQKFLTYRIAFLLPVFSTLMRFLMLYYLWRAAFANSSGALGYTLDSMISYYLFVAVAEIIIGSNTGSKIAGEIKSGALSADLIKPYKYIVKVISEELGAKIIYILYSSIGIFLLFFVFRNAVNIKINYLNIPIFIIFCLIGYMINLLVGLILGCSSFWLVHAGGFFSFINQPISFLSGTYFPLDMISFSFLTITPFVFSRFVPAKVITGSFTLSQILFYFVLGIIWAALLYIIYNIIWKLGLKKYESIGI